MKYFLLLADDSDKKWKGKELLSDMIKKEDGSDVRKKIAYEQGSWVEGSIYCEYLRMGEIAPLQHLYTMRIFATPVSFFGDCLDTFGGQLEYLPLLETKTGRNFLLMHPLQALDAIDWQSSEIEAWPTDFKLQAWHNPKGRMFLKPAVNEKLIPDSLNIFRLKDWPGVANIVVSETAKNTLENSKMLGQEWIFMELNINK